MNWLISTVLYCSLPFKHSSSVSINSYNFLRHHGVKTRCAIMGHTAHTARMDGSSILLHNVRAFAFLSVMHEEIHIKGKVKKSRKTAMKAVFKTLTTSEQMKACMQFRNNEHTILNIKLKSTERNILAVWMLCAFNTKKEMERSKRRMKLCELRHNGSNRARVAMTCGSSSLGFQLVCGYISVCKTLAQPRVSDDFIDLGLVDLKQAHI